MSAKKIADIFDSYTIRILGVLKENNIKIENHAYQFSDIDIKEVCRLYVEDGATVNKIAQIFGSTNKPVKRILKENNIPIFKKSKPFSDSEIKEIIKLYEVDKKSVGYICKKFKRGPEVKYLLSKETSFRRISKEGYKYCSICKNEKLLEEFGFDKRSSTGRRCECNDCRKEASSIDYLNHKEKRQKKHKEYAEKCKEQIACYGKEWYEENKERLCEHRKIVRKNPSLFKTYANQLTTEEEPREDENGLMLCKCTKCKEYFYQLLQKLTVGFHL